MSLAADVRKELERLVLTLAQEVEEADISPMVANNRSTTAAQLEEISNKATHDNRNRWLNEGYLIQSFLIDSFLSEFLIPIPAFSGTTASTIISSCSRSNLCASLSKTVVNLQAMSDASQMNSSVPTAIGADHHMPPHLRRVLTALHDDHEKLGERQKSLDDRFETLIRQLSKMGQKEVPKHEDDRAETMLLSDHDEEPAQVIAVKPEARLFEFERFKNRYGEKDHQFCVEALVGCSDFLGAIEDELSRRGERAPHRNALPQLTYTEDMICQVRIQSLALLNIISKVSGASWNGRVRCTFTRPFALFIRTLGDIQSELQRLETKWETRVVPESLHGEPSNSTEEPLEDGYETLLELRCYVDFVKQHILPQRQRYDNLERPEARSVHYTDLWYLFRMGQLVYVPKFAGDEPTPLSVRQSVFRICGIWRPDTSSHWPVKRERREGATSPRRLFKLKLYSIDHNGETYGPYFRSVEVPFFNGSQDVGSLPVFPLCCYSDYSATAKTLQKIGQDFLDRIAQKHIAYRGWTIICDLAGEPLRDAERQPLKHPEYIESDLIVDFKETFQNIPNWRPSLPRKQTQPSHWLLGEDKMRIIQWTTNEYQRIEKDHAELVQESDGIDQNDYNFQLTNDKFLGTQKSPEFQVEDLMLLPRRLFAYALRDRQFHQVDVRSTRLPNAAEGSPFDSLLISEEHRSIIRAAVITHFQNKLVDESSEDPHMSMDQDFIRGKGRGLVILLHGAPGVGKTATAEAIALEHRKPLVAISFGDLGWNSERVESSLREIFRLAHLWNCILLLDEADVYLSQREKTDNLQRNGIVSVFLRVLEYYNGILFLTTNRVGVLDEAIKSRIHISLLYPHLSREHIWTITQMNLERLRKIDAYRSKITGQKPLQFIDKDICDELSSYGTQEHERSLNGRQIRNAVQAAACLAWYEQKVKEDRGEAAQTFWLSVKHFQTVKQTMILHEEYLTRTKGMSDADMASHRGERHDKFRTRENSQTYSGLAMHQRPGSQSSLSRSDSEASRRTQTPQTGWAGWSQPVPRQNSYGFQSTPPTGPRGETSAFMSSAGSPGQQYHAFGPTPEFSPST